MSEKKIVAAQREYANALIYIEIDMFHSSTCWETATEARQAYSKLTSVTAQKEVVKEQIRIIGLRFGWDDVYHTWSKGGVDYTPGQLKEYLINKIIPE